MKEKIIRNVLHMYPENKEDYLKLVDKSYSCTAVTAAGMMFEVTKKAARGAYVPINSRQIYKGTYYDDCGVFYIH